MLGAVRHKISGSLTLHQINMAGLSQRVLSSGSRSVSVSGSEGSPSEAAEKHKRRASRDGGPSLTGSAAP